MNYKKFVPCIYLYKGNAVKSLADVTIEHTNPVALAKFYSDNNADELLLFDMSQTDIEHDEAINMIKDICTEVQIPVTGTGNIHRMEDVKKLLYAGCKKAALHLSFQDQVDIAKEVSLKFGKDKIAACYMEAAQLLQNRELIAEYFGELILLNETALKESIKQWEGTEQIIVSLPEVSLDKLIEILSVPSIMGITGYAINQNAKELHSVKALCLENNILVNTFEAGYQWSDFKLNSDGHLTVVVQDYKTDEVLMVAYMNKEAYEATLKSGKMTYYSRSRDEIWGKGVTSGHYQYVKSLTADCDMDTLLAKVSQVGAACHTGNHTCFFHEIIQKEVEETNPLKVFEDVMAVILDRKTNPKEGSYTNYLFDKGIDKILKKLGEEATEIVIAAKNPNTNEIKYEISDFLYHMMVLMAEKGVTWEEITYELSHR